MDVSAKRVVINVLQFDSHPTAYANIWRSEISIGILLDQQRLHSRNGGNPDGYMSVVVMIVGEHGEDLLVDKEGRLAVRRFFTSTRQSETDTANTLKMLSVTLHLVITRPRDKEKSSKSRSVPGSANSLLQGI